VTLRARGRLALIIVITSFTVLGVLVLLVLHESNRVNRTTIDELYPAGIEVAEVILATTDQERGVWGYALNGDPSFLAPYETGTRRSEQGFDRLTELLAGQNADLLPLLEQAQTYWRVWMTSYAEPRIAEISGGNLDLAREEISDGAGRRVYVLLRSDLALLQLQINTRVANSVQDAAAINRETSLALIATALAATLITVGATVSMVRWVLRPLGELQTQMRRLSREHDTTTPLIPTGPPEIAALGRDAEVLRQSLVSLLDDAAEAHEGLAQESPTVATIRELLRGPTDPQIPGYGLGVASLSSQGSLTGDWWDLLTLDDGGPSVELCDISGHDAAAGVVAVRFKAAVHIGLRSGFRPDDAIRQASATFAKTPSRFASYLLVQLQAGHVRYLNAGHNPPIVVHSDGTVAALPVTGPLVTSMGGEWSCAETELHPGDVVVLYTDGLVEGRDEHNEELGEEQVAAWCRDLAVESTHEPPNERAGYIANGVLGRARKFSVDLRRDDVTVVVAVADREP